MSKKKVYEKKAVKTSEFFC